MKFSSKIKGAYEIQLMMAQQRLDKETRQTPVSHQLPSLNRGSHHSCRRTWCRHTPCVFTVHLTATSVPRMYDSSYKEGRCRLRLPSNALFSTLPKISG